MTRFGIPTPRCRSLGGLLRRKNAAILSWMPRFEELESCAELTADHAVEATASQASMRAFLDWAATTARPDEGAPKVLLAIAKLADAGWVDGTLYIDIAGDDAVTKLSVFADYGFGIRERLLPLARLNAPFDEFVRAVRLAPKLISPFHSESLAGSLILTPPGVETAPDSSEQALDEIAIAESSLTENEGQGPRSVNDAVTRPPPADQPSAVTKPPPSIPEQSGIHTHPTVRRMVAIRPEARRSGNED